MYFTKIYVKKLVLLMPPRPVAVPKNELEKPKTNVQLPKPELNKLKKENAQKAPAIDNQFRNLSSDIGMAEVTKIKTSDETNKLEERVQDDLNKSIQVVSSITSLHISTQKDYEQKVSRLQEKIAEVKAQLEQEKQRLADLKKEKKRVLLEKDSVIENQKREMKEMAYQFSDMLMKTLITITEDFETQTNDFGREEGVGLPNPDRLKEFNLERIRV